MKTKLNDPQLRILAALLAAVMVALTLPLTALAAPEAAVSVCLREDAGETERAAVDVLSSYLEEITGARPYLISDETASGPVISLALRQSGQQQKKGAYVLRAGYNENQKLGGFVPGVFYIDAFDARGVWNGVYGFLRRICGVEIYSADVRTVPKAESLTLPERYWFAYEPTLEYADTDWISPHDLQFALANGLNGTYSPLEAVHGGKINYIWFCHSLTNGIVPEGEFFETHPEYYALTEKNGKREATQLCLSNPDVVKQAIADVKTALEKNYNPDAALNIVSVTQDDNQDYCVCENCAALAEQYGGQSGLMLWFVNQIADAVAEEYPDVVVDTFAYQYTRHAPKDIRPRENVCVRLCSIECCFSHALNDPACGQNTAFMQDLQDWSEISNRLYIWDYTTNYAQTIGIFPDFGVLRENINTFRDHSVVGIYAEGAYYAGECNAEFADLRAYLLACCMQEELTAEELAEKRDGFLKAYYGEGAAEVGEFLDYVTAHAGNEDGHLCIYFSMRDSLRGVTDEDVKHLDALWDAAVRKNLDAGNDDAANRVLRSRLSWRYYEACTDKGDFRSLIRGIPNFRAMRQLIDDLREFGVTRYSEGSTMENMNPSPLNSPNNWNIEKPLTYPIAIACAALVLLLAVVAAIAVWRKKHPLCAVLMLLVAAVLPYVGTRASILFIQWDRLLLYAVVDAAMLLGVAFFGYIAAWARNGCAHPKGKRLLITVLVVLAAAAAPYEVGVLLINTIILDSVHPTFAITLSAFIQIALLAVDLILTLSALRKQRTEPK